MKTTIRNHRLLSVVTALMLVLTMIPLNFIVTAEGTYENGFDTDTGLSQPCEEITEANYEKYGFTADNYSQYQGYYAIANAGNLYWFAELVNGGTNDGIAQNKDANAVVTENITVNTGLAIDGENVTYKGAEITDNNMPREWTPIGYYDMVKHVENHYTGTFDGGNFTISGLYYKIYDSDTVGLFGFVYGTVKNVNIDNSYFYSGSTRCGSIAGWCEGSITNCKTSGSTVYGCSNAGGIAGITTSSVIISHCENISTSVYSGSGGNSAGGIVGSNDGTVEYCSNGAYVCCNAYAAYYGVAGGICGSNDTGTISNCYNTGKVENKSTGTANYAGGIAGRSGWYNSSSNGTIENCYNTGTVNTATSGYAFPISYKDTEDSTITNSYCINSMSFPDNGISKTAAQFASGEVCYALNGDQNTIVFGQTLTGENADTTPTFINEDKSNQVFKGLTAGTYSNENPYEPCTVVTEENYAELGLDEKFVGYYAIANAGNLYWFAGYVNAGNTSANGVVTADIVVNDELAVSGSSATYKGAEINDDNMPREWTPIGRRYELWEEPNYYTGTFDGNGNTISGLYFESGDYSMGLFGYIGGEGTAKNVNIDNSFLHNIYGFDGSCGSIAGECRGKITGCTTSGSSVLSKVYSGGIVGYNAENAEISNCENIDTTVCSNDIFNEEDPYYAGGIVGINYGTVEYCVNGADVWCDNSNSNAGGICGNSMTGKILNCINTGDVETKGTGANDFAGGIAGSIGWAIDELGCTVESSYSIGTVTATDTANAYPIGYLGNGTLSNCYYLSDTETDTYDSTTAKTLAQFKSGEVTYLLNGNQTTINFVQNLTSDSFPVLLSDENTETVYQVTFKDANSTEVTATKYAYTNENKTVSIPTEFAEKKLLILDTDGNFTTEVFTADTEVIKNTTVSTIPAPTYTVTIPESVDFGKCTKQLENAEGKDKYVFRDFEIKYTRQNFYLNNYELKVYLNSDFKLTDGTNEVPYFMSAQGQSYFEDTGYDVINDYRLIDGERLFKTFVNSNDDTNNEINSATIRYLVLDQSKITKDGLTLAGTMTFTITANEREA